MRTFKMIRQVDETGISGTGLVLEGAIYSNGRVVVYWLGKDFNSFGFYDHLYAFYFLHIFKHPTNNTIIEFNNETSLEAIPKERRKKCRHCGFPYESHPKDRQGEETDLRRSCSGNLISLV